MMNAIDNNIDTMATYKYIRNQLLYAHSDSLNSSQYFLSLNLRFSKTEEQPVLRKCVALFNLRRHYCTNNVCINLIDLNDMVRLLFKIKITTDEPKYIS